MPNPVAPGLHPGSHRAVYSTPEAGKRGYGNSHGMGREGNSGYVYGTAYMYFLSEPL